MVASDIAVHREAAWYLGDSLVKLVSPYGSPFEIADRIAEAASGWGADVIVFGSKRRRLSRLAGRGMRERVTAATGLPTLVAPAPLKVSRRVRTEELEPLPSPVRSGSFPS